MTTSAEAFVTRQKPSWEELEALLGRGKRLHALGGKDISRAVSLYRELCTDRARAVREEVPLTTLHYLDGLISRAHGALYAQSPNAFRGVRHFLSVEFPVTLRKNHKLFWIATFLFYGPLLISLVQSLASEDYARNVLPYSMLESMAEAYSKAPNGRPAGQNAAMAGFYVYNNVGIAFRCFATGILFGLGSAFFLVYNGVVTGAVFGHVIRTGGGINILTFVAGHSPFELTAIVISGTAGLMMGNALVDTGELTRLGSLWNVRREIFTLVVGAALFLFVAALIEGFWSPGPASAGVKWSVGTFATLVIAGYLSLAGRWSRS